jgi:hypothetical protein
VAREAAEALAEGYWIKGAEGQKSGDDHLGSLLVGDITTQLASKFLALCKAFRNTKSCAAKSFLVEMARPFFFSVSAFNV